MTKDEELEDDEMFGLTDAICEASRLMQADPTRAREALSKLQDQLEPWAWPVQMLIDGMFAVLDHEEPRT